MEAIDQLGRCSSPGRSRPSPPPLRRMAATPTPAHSSCLEGRVVGRHVSHPCSAARQHGTPSVRCRSADGRPLEQKRQPPSPVSRPMSRSARCSSPVYTSLDRCVHLRAMPSETSPSPHETAVNIRRECVLAHERVEVEGKWKAFEHPIAKGAELVPAGVWHEPFDVLRLPSLMWRSRWAAGSYVQSPQNERINTNADDRRVRRRRDVR